MRAEELNAYTANCFRDDQPPCAAACPLRVDVPQLLERIQKNRLSSAYRAYRNKVLFPGIVAAICPGYCQDACVRGRRDRPVAVGWLEQYLSASCVGVKPERFRIAKKEGRIAVVGGGLSGLGCALQLAQRNYSVTVYEQSDRLGGSLRRLLAEDQYLPEIQAAFETLPCTFVLGQRITDLSQLEADGIYIATGVGGDTFGLEAGMDRQSLGSTQLGVFLGGACLGADPIHALEHGIRVSHSIEKYLKTGLMDGMPETYQVPPVNPHIYTIGLPELPQSSCTEHEAERAVQEAQRCTGCRCTLCYDGCELMQFYNRAPRRIVMDAVSSLQPVKQLTSRINSRLIYGCNQCGLCKELCPEHTDTGGAILETRRQFHRDGAIPPAFYDYWRRDMDHAMGGQSYLLQPGTGETRYLLVPGCQLCASAPELVRETYDRLRKEVPETGIWLGCCGLPARWAGDEGRFEAVWEVLRRDWESAGRPALLFACTSCQKTFGEQLPQTQRQSLYEFLLAFDHAAIPPQEQAALFDPCASRYDPKVGDSVRRLLAHHGIQIHELSHSGTQAQCCGFGGHIYPSNQALALAIAAKRTVESTLPYVVYCANCRDVFSTAGKECRHVLDVLFGDNDGSQKPPHLGQRRYNRTLLRAWMTGGTPPEEQISRMELSEALLDKLDRLLLRREEVEAILLAGEASGQTIRSKTDGSFTTYGPAGVLTCWVVYHPLSDGCYRVENVYAHRFAIESGGNGSS